ncbi:33041_t:CDS:2 [Racocetra persica]|uniref:33041_t:CDS:1 n=1 Tax=Racocetra persica TaxID=160502 RepID=A0ACA9QUW3_9GLOM|nr:33041_t:CDS:2 [Racocetra persica]
MSKKEAILKESLKIIEKIQSSECKNKDKTIYKKNIVNPIIKSNLFTYVLRTIKDEVLKREKKIEKLQESLKIIEAIRKDNEKK